MHYLSANTVQNWLWGVVGYIPTLHRLHLSLQQYNVHVCVLSSTLLWYLQLCMLVVGSILSPQRHLRSTESRAQSMFNVAKRCPAVLTLCTAGV